MHVNLLPSEFVAHSRLVRAIKNWGLAIALWLLTLAAVSAPLEVKAFRIQQELDRFHSEVGPLRIKESKTRQLRSIARDLARRTERIQSVLPPNRIPSLLGIFGKTFHSEDAPIAIQDFLLTIQSETKNSAPTPGNATNPQTKTANRFSTQILLRGYTANDPTVAEVIQKLDEYGVFQNVLLRSTKDAFVASHQVDEFELECGYVE
jgi:hypothetical protein